MENVATVGGAKRRFGVIHGQAGNCASDQDLLVGKCGKGLPEEIQTPHHGSCAFSSSSKPRTWSRNRRRLNDHFVRTNPHPFSGAQASTFPP